MPTPPTLRSYSLRLEAKNPAALARLLALWGKGERRGGEGAEWQAGKQAEVCGPTITTPSPSF